MSQDDMLSGHLHSASMRVLAESHAQLVQQMAEVTVAHHQATEQRREQAKRLAALEGQLTRNTDMTAELLDVVSAVKSGFRVLGWLGTAAKWLGYIAAGAGAVYTLFYMATHAGQPPK